MSGEFTVSKLLLLLLPLFSVHAQTPAANVLPRATSIRRAPNGSFRKPSASGAGPVVQSSVLPRILAGSNWETTVVLLNTGSASVTFQQFFFAPDGTPISYTINAQAASGLTTSAIQGVLGPGASLSMVLSDKTGAVPEGWSLLTYDDGPGVLVGYAIIRRTGLSGGFPSETTVPFSDTRDYSVYVPFDNTLGFRSQLTLLNPAGNLSSHVQLTYLDPKGKVLLTDSVTLQPAQQMTVILPDTYPDLANKSGSVLVEADIDRSSVTALRYNDAYGAVAALPVITRSASLLE